MKVILPLMLIGVCAAIVVSGLVVPAPSAPYADTAGREEPLPGALFENGWNIHNHGDALFRDTFIRYRSFLGEPVSGFDAHCQTFRLGRLCFNAGNRPDWRVEFANLGALDMAVEGYTPNPGRAPHPALRDWLVAQIEVGLDTTRLVGRIISDPVCDRGTRRCVQWAEKQRFEFEASAIAADAVQRQPLGLWLTHPKARPAATPVATGLDLPRVLLACAVALIGLALLARAMRGEAGSTPIAV
jgi:hypothetical protein